MRIFFFFFGISYDIKPAGHLIWSFPPWLNVARNLSLIYNWS